MVRLDGEASGPGVVDWFAVVSNAGTCDLESVRAGLGRQVLDNGFTLGAGETRRSSLTRVRAVSSRTAALARSFPGISRNRSSRAIRCDSRSAGEVSPASVTCWTILRVLPV